MENILKTPVQIHETVCANERKKRPSQKRRADENLNGTKLQTNCPFVVIGTSGRTSESDWFDINHFGMVIIDDHTNYSILGFFGARSFFVASSHIRGIQLPPNTKSNVWIIFYVFDEQIIKWILEHPLLRSTLNMHLARTGWLLFALCLSTNAARAAQTKLHCHSQMLKICWCFFSVVVDPRSYFSFPGGHLLNAIHFARFPNHSAHTLPQTIELDGFRRKSAVTDESTTTKIAPQTYTDTETQRINVYPHRTLNANWFRFVAGRWNFGATQSQRPDTLVWSDCHIATVPCVWDSAQHAKHSIFGTVCEAVRRGSEPSYCWIHVSPAGAESLGRRSVAQPAHVRRQLKKEGNCQPVWIVCSCMVPKNTKSKCIRVCGRLKNKRRSFVCQEFNPFFCFHRIFVFARWLKITASSCVSAGPALI